MIWMFIMTKVFISYRRMDSENLLMIFANSLSKASGIKKVFVDRSNTRPVKITKQKSSAKLKDCDVMLGCDRQTLAQYSR